MHWAAMTTPSVEYNTIQEFSNVLYIIFILAGKSAHSLKNAHYWGGYKNSESLIQKLQPKTIKPDINEVGMVKTVEDQELKSEGYKVHAFNILVSRELSYHRDIPDTRHHL